MNAEDLPLDALKAFGKLSAHIDDCRQKGLENKPCYAFPTLHLNSTDKDIEAAVEASIRDFQATVPQFAHVGEQARGIILRTEQLAAKAYVEGLREQNANREVMS